MKSIQLILIVTSLTSCYETRTSNANETMEYWLGSSFEEVIPVQGQLWCSANWTTEYVLFLKIAAPEQWWEEVVNENSMTISKDNWDIPNDAPSWFQPSHQSILWIKSEDVFGSQYLYDPIADNYYIYEIQL